MAGFRRDRSSMSRAAKRKQQERDKLDATPPWQHARHDDTSATTGPYDVKDTPDDDHERVDLGALRLPVVKGIDIQAEADSEGRVSTVRLVRKGTQMQVGVFAAPRAEGIWDEIREEIASSMSGGGGAAEEVDGDRFGTELRGELAGARGARTPVRFLGVDGPAPPTRPPPSRCSPCSPTPSWCAGATRCRSVSRCRCTCRRPTSTPVTTPTATRSPERPDGPSSAARYPRRVTVEPPDRGDPVEVPERPDRQRSLREELTSHEMREKYRSQMMASIGGWTGTVIATIPTIVFVAVNIGASLKTAVIAAIGSAVVLALYRLARRQSVLQAASGLVGVVIAAAIAARTGEARNFFLVGILLSFAYGLAFLVSMLVRRPLVGLAWEFLDPISRHHPTDGPDEPRWYRHRQLLRAYQWATLSGVVLFMTRGIVQTILYALDETTSLGIVKIVMGYPLWISAVIFSFWIVRRTRHRLYPPKAEPAA